MKKCKINRLNRLNRKDSVTIFRKKKKLFNDFCNIVKINFVAGTFKKLESVTAKNLTDKNIPNDSIKLFLEFYKNWYNIYKTCKSYDSKYKLLCLFKEYSKNPKIKELRNIHRGLEHICNNEINNTYY